MATAQLLFETATLRSGFLVQDQVGFAQRIEQMLKQSLSLSPDEAVEDEPELEEDEVEAETESTTTHEEDDDNMLKVEEEHSEL